MSEQSTSTQDARKSYDLELWDFLVELQRMFDVKEPYATKNQWAILLWAINKLYHWPQPKSTTMDPIEEFILKTLRGKGSSYDQCAYVLDRSASTLFEWCKKNGIDESNK